MINKINSVLFLSALVGMSSFFLFLPKQKLSEGEKRKLAVFPSFTFDTYLNGTWADSLDEFVDDHFPFRNKFISMAETFNSNKGIHLTHQEKIFIGKKRIGNTTNEEDTTHAKMNFKDDFDEAYSGSLLILDGSVYPVGGGNPKMSKFFSAMLNEYADKLRGRTRVLSAVAPLSSAFIPALKYRKYNTQNKETLLAIKSSLTNGAIFCDVFNELDKHANEKMFFSTDHHWNATGAYYAYVAFCRGAGFTPVDRDKMEKKVKYNFLGSLYQLTRDPSVKANPDTLVYYVPNVTTTAVRYNANNYDRPTKASVFSHASSGGNTYLTFLGGDAPLIKITTSVKNGKKAVVIKNSMGNAFAVYLISHYEEVYVLDFRYSNHNLLQLIEKNNINDLIFALGMYGAQSQGTIGMMRRLATNNGVPKRKSTVQSDSNKVKRPVKDTLKID
jgi:hypothetical protein